MDKKKVIVAGKGVLAVKVSTWFLTSEDYKLCEILPLAPEPDWCASLAKWAEDNEIPIVESGDYRDRETEDIDLFVSVFYDKIIKKDFIDSCGKIINIHNGPLPLYRGVAPINWALKNGEDSHGVTIHEITPGIDDGPIYGQLIYPIYPDIEEVRDVYSKSLTYGWGLFLDVAPKLYEIEPRPQNSLEASYYSSKDKHELGNRLDWSRST